MDILWSEGARRFCGVAGQGGSRGRSLVIEALSDGSAVLEVAAVVEVADEKAVWMEVVVYIG